ncbi:MAG: patatin-like phospholipase family protein, partial [Spirochaetaceae bacterium]|nr:patatin-like phospholipase family protein [Spirochaetaceae bacterium]
MKKKATLILSITLFILSPIFAAYPKVAVVLSGGGAKGYAEIAVIEEIQKLGIPIDFICGTSMGALVGGFYAAGYSSEEIKRMIKSNDMASMLLIPTYTETNELPGVFEEEINSFYSFGISNKGIGDVPGLVGDQLIQQFLSRFLIKNSSSMAFSKLSIPFKAVTTNVTTSDKFILDSGLLQDAMRASMSLPLIFSPYILLDGTYTMDGGLNDNLPVFLARDWGADIIIAVNVSADGLKEPGGYSTLSGVTLQLISLITFKKSDGLLGKDDLVIKPQVSDFTILNMGRYDDILKKGYEAAIANKDKLLALRDKIAKTRDLVPYSVVGTYSQLPDPLVREVRIVDVTRNSQSYSLSTIFDEFIGKTLNDANLDKLESD